MNTATRYILLAVAIILILGVGFFITETPAHAPETPGMTENGLRTYDSSMFGITLHYKEGYTIDESYQYQNLGPGKEIPGVKFTIPASYAEGTNLASDSYFSVEELPQATTCSSDLFLDTGGTARNIVDDGVSYSFASTTGAGAGNRYEEWVYAMRGTKPCIAVRYFIHYGVIDNYPPGTVQEFDTQKLISEFARIRTSLTLR